MQRIPAHLRLPIDVDSDGEAILEVLVAKAVADEEFCLDLVDAALHVWEDWNRWRALTAILNAAGSVWKVEDNSHTALTRVVSDEVQATYDSAVAIPDEASTELKEAWANAFGRNGDPSDAWDHSIKALEDLLIPIVVPKQAKPNLGHVVGQLRNQGQLWELPLPGKDRDHDVSPLVGMLDLIWPNHDRHGGGQTEKRPTSPEEARAVVTLTATILHWHREGWIVRLR